MESVNCLVHSQPNRISFRWSQGDRHFSIYTLVEHDLEKFTRTCTHAQQTLKENPSLSAFQKAQLGFDIYNAIFPKGTPDSANIAAIKSWLENLTSDFPLEIVADDLNAVPWHLVYCGEPVESNFATAEAHSECWKGFWGIRHPLGITQRINPLRRMPLVQPTITVLASDTSHVPGELFKPTANKEEGQTVTLISSIEECEQKLADAPPEILCIYCPVTPKGFRLGNHELTFAKLAQILRNTDFDIAWNDLLVVVCPTESTTSRLYHEFLQTISSMKFSGVVLPSHSTAPETSRQVLAQFLERFLNLGDPAGESARNSRAREPKENLDLLCWCPPKLQIVWSDHETQGNETFALTESPFRPFSPLEQEDRPLLVGRNDDNRAFLQLLESDQVNIAILHGRTGVGKSSLLRSAVLPSLSCDGKGFQVLSNRHDEDVSFLSVPCTQDLAGQLAIALVAHAGEPISFKTPIEEEISVDLKQVIIEAIAENSTNPLPHQELTDNEEALVLALRRSLVQKPCLFVEIVNKWSASVGKDLVILIENMEELYTLTKTASDLKTRTTSFEIIGQFAAKTTGAKLVLSLRTEYLGRILAKAFAKTKDTVADYLLSPLKFNYLKEILLFPNIDYAIPFSATIPAEWFEFAMDETAATDIAKAAIKAANEGKTESLVFVHVVGEMLKQLVSGKKQPIITTEVWEDLRFAGIPRSCRSGFLASIYGLTIGPVKEQNVIEMYFNKLFDAPDLKPYQKAILRFIPGLYQQLPDGVITSTAATEGELVDYWKSTASLEKNLEQLTSPDTQLLQETVMVDDQEIYTTYSLQHDAMAPILAGMNKEVEKKQYASTKVADVLWLLIPVIIVILVFFYRFYVIPYGELNGELENLKQISAQFETVGKEFTAQQWAFYRGQVGEAFLASQNGDLLRSEQLLAEQRSGPRFKYRGFEWFHAQHQLRPATFNTVQFLGEITDTALTSDGKHMAAVATDGNVIIFDLTTGLPVFKILPNAKQSFSSCAISEDKKDLYVGDTSGKIVRWELKNDAGMEVVSAKNTKDKSLENDVYTWGRKTQRLAHSLVADVGSAIRQLAYAKSQLIALNENGKIIILKPNDAEKNQNVDLGDFSAVSFSVPESGQSLLILAKDGKLALYDIPSKKLNSIGGSFSHAQISADGKQFVTVSSNNSNFVDLVSTITLRNTDAPEKTSKTITVRKNINSLAVSRSGKEIITADDSNLLQIWEIETGKSIFAKYGHIARINHIVDIPKKSWFVSCSIDGQISIWNRDHSDVFYTKNNSPIVQLIASSENNVVTRQSDESIQFWDINKGRITKRFTDTIKSCKGIAFLKQKENVLLASLVWENSKGKIDLYEVDAESKTSTIKTDLSNPHLLSASNDGLVVACANENHVSVFQADNGQEMMKAKLSEDGITCIKLSTDGSILAVGDYRGGITLFDTRTGKLLVLPENVTKGKGEAGPQLREHTAAVTAMAFFTNGGPNNFWLASGSVDRSILMWDLSKQKVIQSLRGHAGTVTNIQFVDQYISFANLLVSSGMDGTTRLWGLPGQRFVFDNDGVGITGLWLNPEETSLVTSSVDGRLQVLRSQPHELEMMQIMKGDN